MEFLILGPLEVRLDGEPVSLGAAKQRALLAILLLQPNQVVSSERLIDDLWGERPPATAANALQVYVAQLRKALEPRRPDRKSTRLNSSHANISYAVFCLKKKKKNIYTLYLIKKKKKKKKT